MIYIDLLLGFLKVGCFSFGGAYSAIPLIRDVVMGNNWLSDEALSYMIAVSESTPGPIMVNLATYVGSTLAGLPGALLATVAVVLPSFIVILLAMGALKKWLKNKYVQAALRGLKPCIIGVILATGAYMTLRCLIPGGGAGIDIPALAIATLLGVVMLAWRRLRGKKLSPIALIVISAVAGVALC